MNINGLFYGLTPPRSYFGYNSLRQMVAATNANGVASGYGYCDCGALVFITNAWNTAAQQVITNAYDYQGNRTYAYYPDHTVTNWYNALGQVYQTGDGHGTRYVYYNNQGLVTNLSNAYGTEKGTLFDLEDRPVAVTDANGVTLTQTYDVLGRLRTRSYPDGGSESFGYSPAGLVAYTNQAGMTNFFAYDAAGRKTFETNANGEVLRYTNSPAGDLLSLTDGKNQTTRWGYNQYGLVTNKVDQAGSTILRYYYDANGQLSARWSVAKGTTYYTYDAAGNLTYIQYPGSPSVTLAYDWLNQVTNMVDAAGTTRYTYTSGGQLRTEGGLFAADTVTNLYVNRLRTALGLAQPAGAWTNGFVYDLAGRLTNVTSQAGRFGYLFSGNGTEISRLLLPNSAYITNTFDPVARLAATVLKNSSGSVLDSAVYGYNLAGQRTSFTNAAGTYVLYGYDALGQLLVANSSVSAENRGYFYDAAWNLNRLTNSGTVYNYGVDSKNELTSAPSPMGTLSYDGNGNLTANGNYRQYFYDDENRLTGVWQYDSATNAVWRTDFVYDGLGRLRKRLEYIGGYMGNDNGPVGLVQPLRPGGGTNWYPANEVHYIYDGKRVIQERDSADVPVIAYTRGLDLSGSLEGAGGIGGLLARSYGYSGGNWSTHSFYHADGNGNITYLINSSQAMVATYRYDPFGNTVSQSGALADANTYRFSSKEILTNSSGMYYFLYRFYDPNLQRWINRDPLSSLGAVSTPSKCGAGVEEPNFPGPCAGIPYQASEAGAGQALFRFVDNAPTMEIDHYGLCPCTPEELRACLTAIATASITSANALANCAGVTSIAGIRKLPKCEVAIAAAAAAAGTASVVCAPCVPATPNNPPNSGRPHWPPYYPYPGY